MAKPSLGQIIVMVTMVVLVAIVVMIILSMLFRFLFNYDCYKCPKPYNSVGKIVSTGVGPISQSPILS